MSNIERVRELLEGRVRLSSIIKDVFKYEGLREGQDEIVDLIMQGKDVIGIFPTGFGKTSCFVIPALAMRWPLVVFSPLQALMRDQCMSLCRSGIKAVRMSGDQSEGENLEAARRWQIEEAEVMFVAPERLQNQQFLEAMRRRSPMLISVDEAHTVAEWSDNFRPQYARVGDFIKNHGSNVRSVAAFSATLPPLAEDEVRAVLGIPSAFKVKHYPRRKNLKLTSSKEDSYTALIKKLDEINGPTIIYCSTKKNTEEVASKLSNLPRYYQSAVCYHSKVNDAVKRQNQDDFMADRVQVIAATNAFGMGVNKPNIRGIIHWDLPGSLEALTQEQGRGGRDGATTICHAFLRQRSIGVQRYLLDIGNPTVGAVNQVFLTISVACNSQRNKTCQLSNKEIAEKSNIPDGTVSACISRLQSALVVERYKKKDTIFIIKFPEADDRDRRELAEASTKNFEQYERVINKIGVGGLNGTIEFDMDALCDSIGVSENTIRGYLRTWQREDFITFTPPYKGMYTKLIGSLDLVPMDKVRQKRQDNFEKLRDVEAYFDVADGDKHKYLEDYFNAL